MSKIMRAMWYDCMVEAHMGMLYQISENDALGESEGTLPSVTRGSRAHGLKVSGKPLCQISSSFSNSFHLSRSNIWLIPIKPAGLALFWGKT